jgi:outer membrane protein
VPGAVATTLPVTTQPAAAATQPSTRATAERPPELQLTLAEVRRLALENNLDLKVSLLDPEIARTSVTEEQARFEALFTTDTSFAKTDAAVASQLTGSQTSAFDFNPGLQIPLLTGGSIQLGFPIDRFETNNQFSTLNPSYSAGPSAQLTLPLLRGFGFDVNAQSIRVAFYQYETAQAETKLSVTRVLADVERVYWRLYAAREQLKLRHQQYDLALAQLERARRQARAGMVPEVDLVRAESGVADQVEAVILAQNDLRARQRDLKRILNVPGLEMETPTLLVPATAPRAVVYHLDGPALARAALTSRMEMLEAELQIATEAANVRVARNGMLPLVSLQYTYNINGLGPVLDEALTQVWQKRFEDHRVSLHVEVPVGNQAAESRLRRALLSRTQRLAGRDQRAAQVRQEVLVAVDELETNWQRILAARERVIAAARVVDAEIRQFNQGLRTSTDVLDAQTRLADARLSEITAITEYQIAQVDIAFATGTVLGASHVVWQPTTAIDKKGRE